MSLLDRLRRPGAVLLDSADASGHTLLFDAPAEVLEARTLADVPPLLERLDEAAERGLHAAGFLAYEAGYAFEKHLAEAAARHVTEDKRLAWFGLYHAPTVLDADEVAEALNTLAGAHVRDARFGLDRETYREHINAVRALIREGEVYQINFTDAVDFRLEGEPLALFARLRRRQRAPFAAYLHVDDREHVLSLSPELFVRRDGRTLTTRPMKGTAPRGRYEAEDHVRAGLLRLDAKSQAENLMIVDLLRNDLSVVCEPGSVAVPELFTVERYETVLQMTSTVEGRLREGVTNREVLRALFPCGSVTGAPKLRAMRRIAELERRPRGVYCGAVGHLAPGGDFVLSVAIRTAVVDAEAGRGTLGVGSGVVWDSDADAEFDECLLKAQFLTAPPTPSFGLIETMRWEDGAIRLLALHADRLASSARHLGFAFDEMAWREALHTAAANLDGPHRVRSVLHRDGTFDLTTSPLEPAPVPRLPLRLTFAEERLNPADPLYFHKTTHRSLYERAFEKARAAGYDEVLLLNPHGEVCEGTRSNVFIKKGSAFYTPPVRTGLLPGVYRRHLLDTLPLAEERVLRPRDLFEADALYVCNALWGLRPAVITPDLDAVAAEATLAEGA